MVFNSYMLKLAREARGITQEELADKSQISQGLLSKVEHNLRIPDAEQIKRIAATLDFPESFFFQTGNDIPSGLIFHRKRSSLKVSDLQKIEAEAKISINGLKILMPAIEIEVKVPQLNIDDYSNCPAKVAQALRAYWKVPRGPINNLTTLLENNGIIIIKYDFGNDLLDGFHIKDDLICIILNSRFPADRQRLTLAHELGHIVLHEILHEQVEDEANAFAAEFLMPAAEMDEYFCKSPIDLRKLASLKPIWKVSIASLLFRAKELKYITDSQSRRLWTQISMCGYRIHEPIKIEEEQPTLMQEIIQTYLNELGYSSDDLMKVLHLFTNDFYRQFLRLKLSIK